MADNMGVLLLTWNQAFYRYGFFDFEKLELWLTENMALLNSFRQRNILSYSALDNTIIKQLFEELLFALQSISADEKVIKRSPVAASKALHLVAPDFLPFGIEK